MCSKNSCIILEKFSQSMIFAFFLGASTNHLDILGGKGSQFHQHRIGHDRKQDHGRRRGVKIPKNCSLTWFMGGP